MAKDPAALLYIDKWLVATKDMRGEAKGWYLNLILFQYDMGDLPNDIEELANLCDVRFSEFDKFKQVFEQVLMHKFEENENGRLENAFAKEILQKRKTFVEKRSNSGKLSYLIKYARKKLKATDDQVEFLKQNLNINEIDTKNEQAFKQVLEQTLKLFIDINVDVIKYEDIIKEYDLYCPNLPRIIKLSTTRKKHIAARINEHGRKVFTKALEKAGRSKFLNGANDRNWRADIDWIIKASNFLKIIEGRYDGQNSNNYNNDL